MIKYSTFLFSACLLAIALADGCQSANSHERDQYISIIPDYHSTGIQITGDTLRFPLDRGILPRSSSFNYQELNGHRYISFSDQMSQTVNIYDFDTRTLHWKIQLGTFDPQGKKFGKITGWFRNVDSVYISSGLTLYRTDTTGTILNTIDLSNKQPLFASTSLQNSAPPVFRGQELYLPAFPYLYDSKLDDVKKWPALCNIHLKAGNYSLLYNLPVIYYKNLYGGTFLVSYYCYNNLQQFVFSFPADPNIYISSPEDFSHTFVYDGKSRFLPHSIPPVTVKDLETGEATTKSYLLRDSYGAIYYDPFRNRYLRVAEKKLDQQQYSAKQWKKEHSLIIFDKNFKIIGESPIDKDINLYTLFITKQGIFARTDALKKDENNLYFVRLDYVKNI